MKTASKVINDRIEILNKFLERKMDNPTQEWNDHKEQIAQVKNSFEALAITIDGCASLKETGDNTADYIEAIKELVGQTIVPLIEGTKQQLESFSQTIYSLRQKLPTLGSTTSLPEADQAALKAELQDIAEAIKGYEAAKNQTSTYLEEYETALEEIKEFLIAQEVEEIVEEIDHEQKNREESLAADVLRNQEHVEPPPIREETSAENQSEENTQENNNENNNDNGEFPI